jgi:hypothetical protein
VEKKAKLANSKITPDSELRSCIARFDPKIQKLAKSVRTAVRRRFPAANELVYDYGRSLVIGYSPSEHGIESIVSTATRADGVALYFNNGPRLPDPKGLLLGTGKATRFIQLDSARQVAHRDTEAFIVAAIGLSKVPLPKSGKGVVIIKSGPGKKKPARKAKKARKR